MPTIITSKTRLKGRRPPEGRFVLNKDSPQAEGLVAWWPLNQGGYAGGGRDFVSGLYAMTQNGTMTVHDGPHGGLSAGNTGSTSNWFENATAIVSAAPLTLSCWFNVASATTVYNLVVITNSGVTTYFDLDVSNTDPVDGQVCAIAATAGEAVASSGRTFTANTWNLGSANFGSTTNRVAYLNGIGGTANTTSKAPGSLVKTTIGAARSTTTTFAAVNGRIADVRIHNIAQAPGIEYAKWDPRTRWELYYVPGVRVYSFAPAAPAAGNRRRRVLMCAR